MDNNGNVEHTQNSREHDDNQPNTRCKPERIKVIPLDIAKLLNKHSELELARVHKDPKTKELIWSRWRHAYTMTEQPIQVWNSYNNRTICPAEIVLDIDNGISRGTITRRLNKHHLSYELWDSGSKGFHYHLWFPELSFLSGWNRTIMKEKIIRFFGGETSKKSRRVMIMREGMKHHKTGRLKKLILKVRNGVNKTESFLKES